MELVESSTEGQLVEATTLNYTSGTLVVPLWQTVFNNIQLTVSITGALLNILTFMALNRVSSLNRLVSLLLKHQAFLDFLVCLFGAIIIQQPFMWTVGIHVIDITLCHVWHSLALYWWVVQISIWNLVLLAIDF